jgi:AcrR family transcriptional regulator
VHSHVTVAAGAKLKPNNKKRILEATVALMNQQGGAIGTSQIVDYLGISPGNLYYHFATARRFFASSSII